MAKTTAKIIVSLQKFFSGKLTGKKFLPGIAWFFILLTLLCLPGRDIPKTNNWMERIYFDKWVHIGLFGMLAVLFMAPVFGGALPMRRKKIYVTIIVFAIIAWGLTTEFIQHAYIEGRSFDLYDWMADSIGTFLAIFISKYYFSDKPGISNG
jgi:VanZ family protein